MVIVDAHCDTLTEALNSGMSLVRNPLHWDIQRAMQYDGFVQVFAVFQHPDKIQPTLERALWYLREAEKLEKQTSSLKLCRSFRDIENGLGDKKVCGILSLEGGEALEGKPENLPILYHAGIRCITLTWNYANALGDGAETTRNGGITPFGREVVRWMQKNGMLVDISHANEKTFWDCLEECSQPVIASHSNARMIHEHGRNLRDHQIRAIAKTCGVVGINFFTEFLNAGKSSVETLIRHIEHICEIAGEDTVGLGADFDGMDSLPEFVYGVQSLNLLFDRLACLNYSDQTLGKIAGGNFLRVFKEVLRL